MATMITIDEELLDQLKTRAAEEGTTVGHLIEESLRLAARRPTEDGKPFQLVTFGKGGRFTDLNVDRASALIELDDVGRHGRIG